MEEKLSEEKLFDLNSKVPSCTAAPKISIRSLLPLGGISFFFSDSFMELIPGLPNDVAVECLIRLPLDQLPVAASVCRGWKTEIDRPEFRRCRKATGLARSVVVLAHARVELIRTPRVWKCLARHAYGLTLCYPETSLWSELPPVPGFPDGLPMFCSLVGVGSDLVVMGGYDPVTCRVSNSVSIYNFVSLKWRRGTAMPGRERVFFGCTRSFDRTVYVAGGHDDNKNALRSAMMYDVAKDEWVQLPDMAKERDECKAVLHRGKILVVGGYPTEMQGRFQRDAEALDVTTRQWNHVQDGFLETATYPTTCVDGGDEKIYTCHDGNVMAHEGATWQVVTALPDDVATVFFMTAWQKNFLVMGYSHIGGPNRAYVMDLKHRIWTKLELFDKYSSLIQSGCCLEI
ncbi:hypothetical protein U1Q18_006645 [Sarracenia purpurea var. burkii]